MDDLQKYYGEKFTKVVPNDADNWSSEYYAILSHTVMSDVQFEAHGDSDACNVEINDEIEAGDKAAETHLIVKVCDAIMGSGKTESAITYMNSHPDQHFIYITPYRDEARRIIASCPALNFTEPETEFTKKNNIPRSIYTQTLVNQNRNIASTHQCFRFYKKELRELIKERHYTLIIDESVEILSRSKVKQADFQLLKDAGYITQDERGVYRATDKGAGYTGGAFDEVLKTIREDDIIEIVDGNDKESCSFFWWCLSAELLRCFDDVIVLTYLFPSCSLHHLIEMNEIPYRYIGVSKTDGVFSFADSIEYIPEYTKHLGEMIDIFDNDRMNAVGNEKFALSQNWFLRRDQKHMKEVKQLKKHIYNYFKRYCTDGPDSRMWSTYSKAMRLICGDGYTKKFLVFNKCATNDYGDRTWLAYCVNIYMNVGQKLYYKEHGIEADEDAYALSVMLQWIWRSAIRNGEKIHIYIPSARMRGLLRQWITNVTAKSQEDTQDETDSTAA